MCHNNKFKHVFLSMLLILQGCTNNKYQNGAYDQIINEYNDAFILRPENSASEHSLYNWYHEINYNEEKIILRAGSEINIDKKPTISLNYPQSSDTVVVWRYAADYQSISDIRLSKDSSKIYYVINNVFPKLLWDKGENSRSLHVFDLLKKKELCVVKITGM